MTGFSNALENSLLNHTFGGEVYTPSPTLYFGLSVTDVAEDGTNLTEVSGISYARVAVTNNTTNFPTTTTGSKKNGTAITFPQAGGTWTTANYWFVSTANSGGTILASGALVTPKTATNGDTISFAVNALTINLE